ncbi:doxX-like family protein [Brucella pseudogrignonensis]|uniref:DoxX-like family protein n=2 Tax=Brucella pseudogrignonensis TaxID=419475 RepID=A0A256GMB4_9HYPH|nr:doxX-like family protein [Brucella pseudogrignonensis]
MSRPKIPVRATGFVAPNLRIRNMTIRSVFTTGLAFLLSPQNAASYARWAYPDWFHYITATLELAAAALLINPATRKLGAAIGSFVMAAASLTTLFHAEYDQAIAPLIVLTVSLLTFILSQGVHPEN